MVEPQAKGQAQQAAWQRYLLQALVQTCVNGPSLQAAWPVEPQAKGQAPQADWQGYLLKL